MTRRDVIGIGTSAGGVAALAALFEALPPGLPAAVVVVVHRGASSSSFLVQVLGRHASIEVREPHHGEVVEPGCVYLAPADHHLVVDKGRFVLHRGPKQHHTRPAVDPLFRSLAATYGPRVAGVLLTGQLDDGVAGLIDIKAGGGFAIVQAPEEAEHPSMPREALTRDHVDLVASLAILPQVLWALATGADPAAVSTDPELLRRGPAQPRQFCPAGAAD
jgi:two-component system chemotaxis response regulator CheB